MLWIQGAIAPVLTGAEEEDLHAGLPALLVQGDHVRLFNAIGIDVLLARDGGDGADAVAQLGGGLEIERL